MKLPKKFFSSKKAYQITISNFDDFRETNSENKEHFIISTFKIGILLTLNYGNNNVLYVLETNSIIMMLLHVCSM